MTIYKNFVSTKIISDTCYKYFHNNMVFVKLQTYCEFENNLYMKYDIVPCATVLSYQLGLTSIYVYLNDSVSAVYVYTMFLYIHIYMQSHTLGDYNNIQWKPSNSETI